MFKKYKKANPPMCWLCEQRLYGGGRSYVLVEDGGAKFPAHRQCAIDAEEKYWPAPLDDGSEPRTL